MAERLTSGAMPDDWKPPRRPPADHDSQAARWFETGMAGGAIVDPSEHDSPPGLYDAPSAPPRADVRTALQYQRAAFANGSPHVFRMTTCEGCGAAVTYSGRADRMPAEVLCPRCGAPSTNQPPPAA